MYCVGRDSFATRNRKLTTVKNHETRVIPPDHQLPPPRHRHRILTIVLSLAILAVFVLVFVYVLRTKNNPAATPSGRQAGGDATVTLATAKTGDIGLYLDSIGTVTPVYTDSITSQVNGVLTQVHYQEGQLVKKGDPLIDIDPSPYAATLLQAQGALERDQNLLGQAKMDLERYQTAWSRNAIPKQTLDDQEKLVLQDQGTVKNDQGTVQFDQVQLNWCRITSPIDGQVGLRLVDPGNVILSSSNTPLVVVTQLSPITIVFPIAEDDLDLVTSHMHDSAKLTVEAFDRADQKKLATGSLITLDNQIDTTTGTVKARAQFANKKTNLFPNQFVNVRLLVTTLKNATLIPSSAIQQNGNASFVYVIEDGTAHMVSIKPGITDGGFTQVQGINPGDKVANSGFEKLQDNGKVYVSTRPAATQESTESEAP
jgi:multidrug efflux system membrane fusion protein